MQGLGLEERSKEADLGGDATHILPFLGSPCWSLGSGPSPGAGPSVANILFPSPTADGLFVPTASAGPFCWGAKLFTPAFPDTASKRRSRASLCLQAFQPPRLGWGHRPGSQDTLHQSCSATISSESSCTIPPMPRWYVTSLGRGASTFPPSSDGLQGQLPGN